MNQASIWRAEIAERIGKLYTDNPHVAAVILGGSTARGHADRYSDVEVGVFWHQDPSLGEREAVVNKANADLIYLYDYDESESVWSDDFMVGRDISEQPRSGLLVEVCHYTAAYMATILNQVLNEYSTRELSHNLIAGVADAVPIYGVDLVRTWQQQAANYPRELSIAVVRNYGVIDHFWRWKMYLDRGENLPLLYQSFTQVHHKLLHMLLGINRVYYFGFKWLEVVDSRLQIKPVDLLPRIRQAYRLPPDQAAQQVIQLVDEVYDLVEIHLPEVDVKRLREIFHYQRPIWDHSPLRVK